MQAVNTGRRINVIFMVSCKLLILEDVLMLLLWLQAVNTERVLMLLLCLQAVNTGRRINVIIMVTSC